MITDAGMSNMDCYSECPNCVVGYFFESNAMPNGWTGYNYGEGANNTFLFQSVSAPTDVTVCVSSVELTFAYGPSMFEREKKEKRRKMEK